MTCTAVTRYWKTTPLKKPPYLSVLLLADSTYTPMYLPAIETIAEHISALGVRWELILVVPRYAPEDPGSLSELRKYANLRVIRGGNKSDRGLRQGVLSAQGRYVLILPNESAQATQDAAELLQRLEVQKYDIAIGRYGGTHAAHSVRLYPFPISAYTLDAACATYTRHQPRHALAHLWRPVSLCHHKVAVVPLSPPALRGSGGVTCRSQDSATGWAHRLGLLSLHRLYNQF